MREREAVQVRELLVRREALHQRGLFRDLHLQVREMLVRREVFVSGRGEQFGLYSPQAREQFCLYRPRPGGGQFWS